MSFQPAVHTLIQQRQKTRFASLGLLGSWEVSPVTTKIIVFSIKFAVEDQADFIEI
jgi:hypothetical protein